MFFSYFVNKLISSFCSDNCHAINRDDAVKMSSVSLTKFKIKPGNECAQEAIPSKNGANELELCKQTSLRTKSLVIFKE